MVGSKKEQMDVGEEEQVEASGTGKKNRSRVYVPGISRPLKAGEEWDFDPSAYTAYHAYDTDLPCLSFDTIADQLGEKRTTFPMSFQLVCGTQAANIRCNELCVTRFTNVLGIRQRKPKEGAEEEESDSESSSSSDDSEDEEENSDKKQKRPKVHAVSIPHHGDINRVKFTQIGPTPICAVWNDQHGAGGRAAARVQIWNLSAPLAQIDAMENGEGATNPTNPTKPAARQGEKGGAKRKTDSFQLTGEKPIFSYSGHTVPGFALAWSPLRVGALASGDTHNKIHLWQMSEAGTWEVSQRPLAVHQASVEDLQWSPSEEALLISCSADKTIRLWDTRSPPKEACVCCVEESHSSDVNVLSWNADEPLIVSGGDDGLLKVWSLKTIQYKQPVATFDCHQGKPITSVEWNPNESTVLMAAGEDDKVTILDLALEADTAGTGGKSGALEEDEDADSKETAELESKLPPQLLFVHMGQHEIKEVHWHKQIPGLALTTALDGFNFFKTINT